MQKKLHRLLTEVITGKHWKRQCTCPILGWLIDRIEYTTTRIYVVIGNGEYSWFCPITAELSSYKTADVATKAWNINCLAFYRKSLPIPSLKVLTCLSIIME